LLHLLCALFLELGNDEVYYIAYARYPQWSFFDHPPAVGWLIRIGTLDLRWTSDFFIRLIPIVCGLINIVLVHRITRLCAGQKAAITAALLFASSIYAQVIAGFFIMPDSSLMTCLLVCLLALVHIIHLRSNAVRHWIIFGLFSGLAFLSKYHGLFIWLGFGLYVLLNDRALLRKGGLYLSGILALALSTPVIMWNIANEFVSFRFQGERIGAESVGINWKYFAQELFGSVAYNNPLVWICLVITLVALLKRRSILTPSLDRLFIYLSLPVIVIFLFSSLFKPTLPHWSAPAYTLLVIPAGAYFAKREKIVRAAAGLMMTIWIAAPIVIQSVQLDTQNKEVTRRGRFDFTLDLYGWKSIGEDFTTLHKKLLRDGVVNEDARLVITKWFPGAHLEHYVAQSAGITVWPVGDTASLHHYAFIKHRLPAAKPETNHYYITTSHFFIDPQKNTSFSSIKLHSIIPVFKGSRHVENAFVYLVKLSPDQQTKQ
jgi:hypothetical protein